MSKSKKEYNVIADLEDGISVLEYKGKYALINYNGRFILELKYNYLTDFGFDGLAVVGIKGNYFTVNKQGDKVEANHMTEILNEASRAKLKGYGIRCDNFAIGISGAFGDFGNGISNGVFDNVPFTKGIEWDTPSDFGDELDWNEPVGCADCEEVSTCDKASTGLSNKIERDTLAGCVEPVSCLDCEKVFSCKKAYACQSKHLWGAFEDCIDNGEATCKCVCSDCDKRHKIWDIDEQDPSVKHFVRCNKFPHDDYEALSKFGFRHIGTKEIDIATAHAVYIAPYQLGVVGVVLYLMNFSKLNIKNISCTVSFYNDFKPIFKVLGAIKLEKVIPKVYGVMTQKVCSNIKKSAQEINLRYEDVVEISAGMILVKVGGLGSYQVILKFVE